jgi:hypothetical protein
LSRGQNSFPEADDWAAALVARRKRRPRQEPVLVALFLMTCLGSLDASRGVRSKERKLGAIVLEGGWREARRLPPLP